jgi:hypothetical protein
LDFCSGSGRRYCASRSICRPSLRPVRSTRGYARGLAVARQLPRP